MDEFPNKEGLAFGCFITFGIFLIGYMILFGLAFQGVGNWVFFAVLLVIVIIILLGGYYTFRKAQEPPESRIESLNLFTREKSESKMDEPEE